MTTMLRILLAALAPLAVVCLGCGPVPAPDERPGDDGVARWDQVWDTDAVVVPEREPCTPEETARLSSSGQPAAVTCNLTLDPGQVVERRLALIGAESSGVTIDCRGATLASPDGLALTIRSRCDGADCEPVHDVTVRDCRLLGGVRVQGMAATGNDPILLETDQTLDHVVTVRSAAPYHVRLVELEVVAQGSMPVYVHPGTHDVEWTGGSVSGPSDLVMVYVGSETDRIAFRGVSIDGSRADRHAVSVDSSSRGVFEECQITSRTACVKAFRNCGERQQGARRGVIRHTTSSGWEATGNYFSCGGAAIWFGSNGGRQSFCSDDEPENPRGDPIGSWESNHDWVRGWWGTGNRLHGCHNWDGNSTNYDNEVTE